MTKIRICGNREVMEVGTVQEAGEELRVGEGIPKWAAGVGRSRK